MKLTIFGPTGETGRLGVEQALSAGDHVVAYARSPSKLELKHERLKVMQGELSDRVEIEPAVSGVDAVIQRLETARGIEGQADNGRN